MRNEWLARKLPWCSRARPVFARGGGGSCCHPGRDEEGPAGSLSRWLHFGHSRCLTVCPCSFVKESGFMMVLQSGRLFWPKSGSGN